MNQFDNLEIIFENHKIRGKFIEVKRVYISETFQEPADLKEYFKAGLKAKEILKYKNDEHRFGWIVWYI